jgi:hypothetical protein
VWAWNQKAKNGDEMGGTSRITTYLNKDVLDVEVKQDIPQDMGLHFVARHASIDKEWPDKHKLFLPLLIRTCTYVQKSSVGMVS